MIGYVLIVWFSVSSCSISAYKENNKNYDRETLFSAVNSNEAKLEFPSQKSYSNDNTPNYTPVEQTLPLESESTTQQITQSTVLSNDILKYPTEPSPPEPTPDKPEFHYDEASFAVTELARKIGQVVGPQFTAGVFSPVSIACALSLLLLGSNGDTKDELSQVMGFNRQRLNNIHKQYGQLLMNIVSANADKYPIPWRPNDQCTEEDSEEQEVQAQIINLANAIFVRSGLPINQRYVDLSVSLYNSSLVSLNFSENPQQAANSINRWASQNTFGKIDKIVSDHIDPDTQVVVANALYFKGLWNTVFEVENTALKKFFINGYDSPDSAKEIPSMTSIGCYPYYDGSDEFNARIIGLPYQGEKTALYIIVPNNSSREVLINFQKNLDAAKIGTMVSRMVVKNSLVQIPKMKISNTINLREVLQKLNLLSIFNPVTSDLSSILTAANLQQSNKTSKQLQPKQPLYVSEIVHRVELEINEQGTEAGAATASTVFRRIPSVQMRIDTPFLMMLGHDDTRLPLFYGSVFDPTGQ